MPTPTPPASSSSPLQAEEIAALHVPNSSSFSASVIKGLASVQPAQTRHRINIVEAWGGQDFLKGAKVLELGCGQGDMTAVLASAVKVKAKQSSEDSDSDGKGSVLGWDPAPGDYGSPMTLAQAQANLLSRSELGPELQFSLSTPITAVLSPRSPHGNGNGNGQSQEYTHAVLAHSLYYHSSPSDISKTFETIASHDPPIKYLCLAEYSLNATEFDQVPHVLATLTQSACESLRRRLGVEPSEGNIRTVLSPKEIIELANRAGWTIISREAQLVPGQELQDGGWEVGTVVSPDWMEEVKDDLAAADDFQAAELRTLRDATENSAKRVKALGGKPRTMDVWCAVLTRSE